MSGLLALKLVGVGVLLGASLVALTVGFALLTNRKGLADRLQRHEERDVVDWAGPVSLLHQYFHRVVRLYGVGLIAWSAFLPGAVIAVWLGPRLVGVAAVLTAVGGVVAIISFFSMFGIAFAMGWQSERAMASIGLPLFSPGWRRVRSAPFQVNAEFWGAMALGVALDVLVMLALKSG